MRELYRLLDDLAVLHRAPAAYRRLMSLGFAAVPIARRGLRHQNAAVRQYCCAFLDHFLVPEALPELLVPDVPEPVLGMVLEPLLELPLS